MDNVKYEGDFITKEIFSSQVCMDGRYRRLTQEERDILTKKIYKNIKLMLKYHVLIPLKLGHDDQNPLLRGYVQDVKLKRKKMTIEGETSNYYSIEAKMFLFKDFLNIYKTGRIPSISPEIPPAGALPNGKKFDDYVVAVAFLGTESPALPWLDKQYSNNKKAYLYANKNLKYRQLFKNKYIAKEFIFMPEMDQILTVLDDAKLAIEALFEESESSEEEIPLEAASEVGMKEKYNRKKFDEYSKEFEHFSIEHKIPKTYKDQFIQVAYTNDLAFAKQVFTSGIVKHPPAAFNLKSSKDKPNPNENKISFLEKSGWGKIFKTQYEQYKKESGGK